MDGSLGSVERLDENNEWKLVVSRARSRQDMRRQKVKAGTPAQSCCSGYLQSLEREAGKGQIMEVSKGHGDWEKVTVTVDSGAIDSVANRRTAEACQVKSTVASQQGLRYRAANGAPIVNEGEKHVRGYTQGGKEVSMTFQVAEVTKPLGSVRAMVKANNRVVFDEGNSYIQDKVTGAITKIDERNGAYVFDLWVPRGNNKVSSGRFAALEEEEETREGCHSMGFVGLDDLM